MNKRKAIPALLALAAVLLFRPAGPCGAAEGDAAKAEHAAEPIRIFVDEEIRALPPNAPEGGETEKAPGLWVTLAVDGETVLELPFGEAHSVRIEQEGIGENTVILTEEAVFMEEADCPGQDCVLMGPVTRDNLETRVMGGFIICLPHRLSVEVWEKK